MTSIAKLPAGLVEESQTERAYAAIEERIATLQLAPGQVVSENILSSMLGFGRTPVREALQQLAREGLVLILPKRGIVVSEIDVRRQLKLLEMRREVERSLVGAAARRAEEEERQEFGALADAMFSITAREDGERFLPLDRAFNRLVLRAAKNEYGTAIMKLMQGLSRRFWFAHYKQFANLAETARLHATIAREISQGRAEQAMQALDALMDNVEAFTRATLD